MEMWVQYKGLVVIYISEQMSCGKSHIHSLFIPGTLNESTEISYSLLLEFVKVPAVSLVFVNTRDTIFLLTLNVRGPS